MSDIYFQHIGSKHFLSPPSLLLTHNGNRSLINAGENVQRYCFEHKIRLSRIKNILLTTISVETVGGLPGLLLTLAGVGIYKVRVVGPEPIIHYLLMFGYVVRAQNVRERYIATIMSINSQGLLENFEYARPDQEIEVIQLVPSSSSLRLDIDQDVYVECYTSSSFPELKTCLRDDPSDSPPAKSRRTEDSSPSSSSPSVLYMFDFPERRGKFDVARARELGIPPGPLYSKLKNGESVRLADSRVVHSSQVCAPPVKMPWSIVLHTVDPSESGPFCSIIAQILNSKGFVFSEAPPLRNARWDAEPEPKPEPKPEPLSNFYVFQLQAFRGSNLGTPPKILEVDSRRICNRRYPSKGVIRVVGLNQGLDTLKEQEISPFITSNLVQKFLNNICPPMFPMPPVQATELVWNQLFLVSPDQAPPKADHSTAAPQRKKPRFAPISRESEHKIQALRREFEALFPRGLGEDNPSALFPCLYVLGTGSAMPSPYRNVSGTLLRLDSSTSILLDCGEGSMSQLFTMCAFNPDVFFRVIASIKVVFISHPHEDHYLGLFKLLQLRKSALAALGPRSCSRPARRDPPFHFAYHQDSSRLKEVHLSGRVWQDGFRDMVIIGPRKVEKILDLFQEKIITDKKEQLSDFEVSFITTDQRMCDAPSPQPPPGAFRLKLENFPVKHIRSSYGLKITFELPPQGAGDDSRRPFTVVFSGDTVTPCPALEDASRGCDILIHEATFEDSLHRDAVEKNHSTISGAVRTAFNSSARFLLITHFSQRYFSMPKVEISDERLNRYFLEKTLCMMDLMVIPLLSVGKLVKRLHNLNQLVRDYLPQV